jgi:hypothetical protein
MIPVGTAIWLIFGLLLRDWEPNVKAKSATVLLFTLVSGALTLHYVQYWAHFSDVQQFVISEIANHPDALASGGQLVVADYSGLLGDVYTFLPPYLNTAMAVTSPEKTAEVILCTPDRVQRNHPVAARYPIASTPPCSEILTEGAELIADKHLMTNSIVLYHQQSRK